MTCRLSPPLSALAAAALALMLPVAAAAQADLPAARWDHRPEAAAWTQAALTALENRGGGLLRSEPADIATFCPAYPKSGAEDRAAFWVGLFSALAKHESTWNPRAAGEGGKYRGLLQIAPATARAYGCDAGQLYDGASNVSCAVTIAARQVARTGVLVGGPGGWGGLAADWGPMRNGRKLADIAAWTRAQDYCQLDQPKALAPESYGPADHAG
jgi:hypothetical protein